MVWLTTTARSPTQHCETTIAKSHLREPQTGTQLILQYDLGWAESDYRIRLIGLREALKCAPSSITERKS
jgi:hypothetical protein